MNVCRCHFDILLKTRHFVVASKVKMTGIHHLAFIVAASVHDLNHPCKSGEEVKLEELQKLAEDQLDDKPFDCMFLLHKDMEIAHAFRANSMRRKSTFKQMEDEEDDDQMDEKERNPLIPRKKMKVNIYKPVQSAIQFNPKDPFTIDDKFDVILFDIVNPLCMLLCMIREKNPKIESSGNMVMQFMHTVQVMMSSEDPVPPYHCLTTPWTSRR